jgi:hypothetical protein
VKTSHVVLAIGAVAAGGAALWYFSRNGVKTPFYPGAQGFPTNLPGGQPQTSVNAGYPKSNSTAQVIDAAAPLATKLFDSIGSLFQKDIGADEPAATEPTGSVQGYENEAWLSGGFDSSPDPSFYT